jgi:hypothetical protein
MHYTVRARRVHNDIMTNHIPMLLYVIGVPVFNPSQEFPVSPHILLSTRSARSWRYSRHTVEFSGRHMVDDREVFGASVGGREQLVPTTFLVCFPIPNDDIRGCVCSSQENLSISSAAAVMALSCCVAKSYLLRPSKRKAVTDLI